jgi:hypothetical protein
VGDINAHLTKATVERLIAERDQIWNQMGYRTSGSGAESWLLRFCAKGKKERKKTD